MRLACFSESGSSARPRASDSAPLRILMTISLPLDREKIAVTARADDANAVSDYLDIVGVKSALTVGTGQRRELDGAIAAVGGGDGHWSFPLKKEPRSSSHLESSTVRQLRPKPCAASRRVIFVWW